MVRTLLRNMRMRLFLCIGCFLSGCLVLDPIVEPSPDEQENFAPSVDPIGVVPSFATFPAVLMVQPEVVTFDINRVEDPNLEDNLTLRFYADGKNEFLAEQVLTPTGELSRAVRDGLVLGPAQLDAFRNENGALEGRHRLELIISDRGFVSDSGEGARQVPAEGKVAYYYWELEF